MSTNSIISQLDAEQMDKDLPEFNPGDTVVVHARIKEGNKERVQIFEGVCIARQNGGSRETFTVRKMASDQVGVERVFPLYSPNVDSIEVVRRGDVRRAKLYYLRGRTGKAARIAEKTDGFSGKVSQEEKQAAREAKALRDEASKKKAAKKAQAQAEAPAEQEAQTEE